MLILSIRWCSRVMVSALSCLHITWESYSALQDSLVLVWVMCLLKLDIKLHCVILHDTNLPQSQQVCPGDSPCLWVLSWGTANEDVPKAPVLSEPFAGTVVIMINLIAVWSLKIVGRIRSRKCKKQPEAMFVPFQSKMCQLCPSHCFSSFPLHHYSKYGFICV